MANKRTILPEMISVSRNCQYTIQLHRILSEKLEDSDFEIFHRWLQIVEDEKKLNINSEVKKFRHF